MVKLILFVCAVVALSATAFATPLAEEKDNTQKTFIDIDTLLKEADPVENDIARNVEVTESTTELPTILPVEQDAVKEDEKEQAQPTKDVQVTPTTASLTEVEDSDEPIKEQEFTDTVEDIIKNYGVNEGSTPPTEETAVEISENVEEIAANTTKTADVKTKTEKEEELVPVTEVIPPPKVAFVLGEYADEEVIREPTDDSNDEYKIVLGETEDGTAFLSEYRPDTPTINQEESNVDGPLVEQIDHEYPQDVIMPGAEFRPLQDPMADHGDVMYDDYNPGSISGPNNDYESDHNIPNYDYGMNDYHFVGPMANPRNVMYDEYNPGPSPVSNTDFAGVSPGDSSRIGQSSDYPTEALFDGRLDYGDDSLTMPSVGSHDYDEGSSPTEDDHTLYDAMDDHTMHDNMPSMHDRPIHDDLKAAMAAELGNLQGAIVAGLHENYHPEPILGMIPFPTEFPEDSSSTTEDSIRPSAMINFDKLAVESTRVEENMMSTPMPNSPSMVDLPQPVAEFTVNSPPMAGMPNMNGDNMSLMDNNGVEANVVSMNEYDLAELSGRPTEQTDEDETIANDIDVDSKPDVVIELDIANQQAIVNGNPFEWERPSSILGFIGQILEAARMHSRPPQRNNYYPVRKPYYNYNNDRMSFSEKNQYAPSYLHSSSYSNDYQSEQYQPSSFDYDYLPYNPYLSALRRRLLEERFNRGRSLGSGSGYNYMSGYNPMQGYGSSYDDYPMSGYSPMQGYNSIYGYDDSMSGYNPMQGYNSIHGYDDSMSGYNPMQEYGSLQENDPNGRSFDYQSW